MSNLRRCCFSQIMSTSKLMNILNYGKLGTEVGGWQAKDGSYRANGSNITFPDGKKLFLGSSGTGAPFDPEKK